MQRQISRNRELDLPFVGFIYLCQAVQLEKAMSYEYLRYVNTNLSWNSSFARQKRGHLIEISRSPSIYLHFWLPSCARESPTLIAAILMGTLRTAAESRAQKPCKSTLIFALRQDRGKEGNWWLRGDEHHRAPRPKCRFIIKIDRVESAMVDLHQDVGDIKSIMQVIERHPVTSVISMLWAPLAGAPAGTRISRSPSAEGRPGHRYSTRDGIFN